MFSNRLSLHHGVWDYEAVHWREGWGRGGSEGGNVRGKADGGRGYEHG